MALILKSFHEHYLLKENPSESEKHVIHMITTSHKVFQNWRMSTRRSSVGTKNVENLLAEGYEHGKSLSDFMWDLVINSSHVSNLKKFAKNFELTNCIK